MEKKKKFVATQAHVDKLMRKIEELGLEMPERQHGRQGQTLENEQDELTRIYHNLHSVIYRAKRKAIFDKPSVHQSSDKTLSDADINEIDLRRFKACFVFESISPEIDYVRRMTGLNDYQIIVLEDYTKMKVVRRTCISES